MTCINGFLTGDTYTKKLYYLFGTHGLTQIVKEPTRITPSSSTLIDMVFTNLEDVHLNCANKFSDHQVIHMKLPYKTNKIKPIEINKINPEKLKNYLQNYVK